MIDASIVRPKVFKRSRPHEISTSHPRFPILLLQVLPTHSLFVSGSLKMGPIFYLLPLLSAIPASLSAPTATLINVPAGALSHGTPRLESSIESRSPDASFSKVSVVSLYEPLPDAFENIVPACDYISYLRYRHNEGPEDSTEAVSVL